MSTIDELMQENAELWLEKIALEASNASLAGVLGDVLKNLKDLEAHLDALGASETRHIIELREGWMAIQHPLSCRPNLLDCAVNKAVLDDFIAPPTELGRFYLDFNGVDVTVGERVT